MSTGNRSEQTWALIAGGGTAGHLLPGLAVARALVARGHDRVSIHFVGGDRGVEAELVPAAGFTSTMLPGRGHPAPAHPRQRRGGPGLVRALFDAIGLVRRRRPPSWSCSAATPASPVRLAAVVWRVPLVLLEQNARPAPPTGCSRRFASGLRGVVPETDLPRAVVTGNPLRAEIAGGRRGPRPRPPRRRRARRSPADRT